MIPKHYISRVWMASYYMYLHVQQQAEWFEDIMDWAVGVDFRITYRLHYQTLLSSVKPYIYMYNP